MSKTCKRPDLDPLIFHGMLTVSERMKDFFRSLEKVARSEANVLVRGETGTGKELVARAIHVLSPRAQHPFQALNCATLSHEMMLSELFGHVKGAFTGAVADRKGLFEVAHGGTIFLDEIAELPLDVQPRLLRVLQDRQFYRLGSYKTMRSNVRLVSATHESLRRLVSQRLFREDLMYRVRVVPVFLPRLAERGADIEMLTWRFIDEFNKQKVRVIECLETRARDAILSYGWPGNIRELRNNIEYAYVMGDGPTLRLGDLTPELRGEGPAASVTSLPSHGEQEREAILSALRQARNRKGAAAKILGMSRSTLWRKLRELDLMDS